RRRGAQPPGIPATSPRRSRMRAPKRHRRRPAVSDRWSLLRRHAAIGGDRSPAERFPPVDLGLWIRGHRFDLELRRERGVSVRNPADHAEYLQFEQIHTAGLAPFSPTVDRNRGVRRNRTIPAIRADAVTTPSRINSRGARSTRRRSSRWSGATSSDERISRAAQLTTAWPQARRRTASTASTQGHQLAATPATA